MLRGGLWRFVLLAALVALGSAACGSPLEDFGELGEEAPKADPSAGDTTEAEQHVETDGDQGGGGERSGVGSGPGGAVGAPIDIPSEQQDNGRPLAEVQAEIEQGVREQCGGELCLTLSVERSDENWQSCQFSRTRPEQGTKVPRGSTVVIVAGTLPCSTDTPDRPDPADKPQSVESAIPSENGGEAAPAEGEDATDAGS